ncbi:MAG: hypothetical protein ACI8TX_001950 [Hyphomicrobiaceae bacterium]|jgi:hypothetical protein
MPRLLYIGHVWPEPRSSAAGTRTLSLMREFSRRGWHVTFCCAAEPGERAEGLAEVATETASIVLNDPSFDEFVADARPDVVVFDRFMTEEQFGWRVETVCPSALRVLDTIDLHCLRRARQAAAGGRAEGSDGLRSSDIAKREIAAILRSDLSLMISRYEVDLLRNEFSIDSDLLYYVPFFGVPARPDVVARSFEERLDFATIGNFLHPPNADSFEWLRDEIWPLIRERLPNAELQVYGAYMPQRALACDNPASGFRVRGWAPDAVSALSQSRVCLAPLRFGAGLKGKIIDAMAAGTPVVTTAIGAEGMGASGGVGPEQLWCGVVAEDSRSLAEAAVELHENRAMWLECQRAGLDILAEEFDAEKLGSPLVRRVQECLLSIEQRREKNFTGAILRHHHHRATEYMARWIQAKNAKPDH